MRNLNLVKYITFAALLVSISGTSFDNVQWSRVQGNPLTDNPLFAAVDAVGGLVYTETYLGNYSVSIPSSGGSDVLVARLNADGTNDWFSSYGSSLDDTPISFSVEGSTAYLGVDTPDTVPISSVIAVDLADGSIPWTDGYENGYENGTFTLNKVGALGDKVYAIGTIDGVYPLGTENTGSYGIYTTVLLEYNATGDYIGTVVINNNDTKQEITGFAVTNSGAFVAINSSSIFQYGVDPYSFGFNVEILGDAEIWLLVQDDVDDGVYVAGKFQTSATFGAETVTSVRTNGDVFLAKLSDTGIWSNVVVLPAVNALADVNKLSLAVADDIYVGLDFVGEYDFDGNVISSLVATGGVAALSRNGMWLNVTTFKSTEGSSVVAVAAVADSLYVVGSFNGQMPVSNYTISTGNIDVFIIKFNVTVAGDGANGDSCFLSICLCYWCKIAAIIAGCVVFVIFLIIVIVIAVKKAKKKADKSEHKMETMDLDDKELSSDLV